MTKARVNRMATPFKDCDWNGYCDAEPLPGGGGPFIYNNNDKVGTEVILGGVDKGEGATIQVFFIKDDKQHSYGITRDINSDKDIYSSEDEIEEAFIEIYNEIISKLIKGQSIETVCKHMNMDKLL